MTEMWLIVESLQQELALLSANVTSASTNASATMNKLDSMGTDMDALWLMVGSVLVTRECLPWSINGGREGSR